MNLVSGVSVREYIVHSMLPDYVGNTIVAAFFLAGSYSFCYGTAAPRLHRRWLKLRGKPVDDLRLDDSAHAGASLGPHDKVDQQQQAHLRQGQNSRGAGV